MKDEIIVRNYTDLKPFFEKKALQNQVILNKNFLTLYDSINNQMDLSSIITDSASKNLFKVFSG